MLGQMVEIPLCRTYHYLLPLYKENKMKSRVYIDTSVVGGYFDEEFKDDTKKFFARIFKEDFIIYFSEISETELSLAPAHVIELKNQIPKKC